MARFFTRDEAERALPAVEKAIREAIFHKSEFQRAEQSMTEISRNIVMTGGMAVDTAKVIEIKETRERSASRLQELAEQLQASGCLIKDLDIGLLDFPTLYHGEEVYLCWRLGETGIAYWHRTDEGFRGRQQIDDEFLANHRGD